MKFLNQEGEIIGTTIKPKRAIKKIFVSFSELFFLHICLQSFLFYFAYSAIQQARKIDQSLNVPQRFFQSISNVFSETFSKQKIWNFSSSKSSLISILLMMSIVVFISYNIILMKKDHISQKEKELKDLNLEDLKKYFVKIAKIILPFLFPLIALSINKDSKNLFIGSLVLSSIFIFTDLISFMLVSDEMTKAIKINGSGKDIDFTKYKNNLDSYKECRSENVAIMTKLFFFFDLLLDVPRRLSNRVILYIYDFLFTLINIIMEPFELVKDIFYEIKIIKNVGDRVSNFFSSFVDLFDKIIAVLFKTPTTLLYSCNEVVHKNINTLF